MRTTGARGRGVGPLTVLLAGLGGLLLIAAGLAGLRAWTSRPTDLQRALDLAPTDALRWSWTDWSAVRRATGAHLGSGSSPEQVDRMLSKGYDDDLTGTSVLTASAGLLQEHYGWSPATLDWELYSQAKDGALMIGHLPDSVSFDTLRRNLEKMGFEKPAPGEDVWDGTDAAYSLDTSGVDAEVSPEITNVALIPDRHLVLSSDGGGYLQKQVDELEHRGSMADGVMRVAGAVGSPLSAYLNSGDYTCSALSMTSAGDTDRAEADELISQAGKVNPVDAMALAAEPGGDVRVAMAFESHEQAVANADSRARLASGPAPGQGGSFTDRFRLGKVRAVGPLVTMALHPKPDAAILSDLGNGPVLFATC